MKELSEDVDNENTFEQLINLGLDEVLTMSTAVISVLLSGVVVGQVYLLIETFCKVSGLLG